MMNNKRLEQLLSMLEKSPDEAFLLFAIAKEYEKADDNVNALKYYHTLTDEIPEYVGTYYHLGKFYEKLENFDKAIEIYEKGMSVAKTAGDNHSLSELAGAKMNLED